MTDDSDAERAAPESKGLSFGSAAREYERGRPTYPLAAIDWMLPPDAVRVLDLGAGTGKLTRVLVDRGLDVVAVEPSPGMREAFSAALPGVSVLAGSAEQVPLPAGSVDAVLVAQAWHWVDPERASIEVARVLGPGGVLGLVWNARDNREPWVAELSSLLGRYGVADETYGNPRVGSPFGPLERHTVDWSNSTDVDGIVDMVASRSYIITLPAQERAEALARARAIVSAHRDLVGRDTIEMPYVTHAYRTSAVTP